MTAPITPDERAAMRERHTASLNAVQRGVAALTDVPRLLDALEAAEAEVARLREEAAPVRPGRMEVKRLVCAAVYGDPDNLSRANEATDGVLALWPGESRATVQAEALHDAAEEIDRLDFGPDQDRPFSTGARHKWGAMQAAERVRARADRLKKGADRG